jgi:hypothetical protein
MTAEEITDPDEYAAAWARITELNPAVRDYLATAERTIPIIALTPRQS